MMRLTIKIEALIIAKIEVITMELKDENNNIRNN